MSNDRWELPVKNLANYKEHIRLQIAEDLQESFSHLETHHHELTELSNKIDSAKSQVSLNI